MMAVEKDEMKKKLIRGLNTTMDRQNYVPNLSDFDQVNKSKEMKPQGANKLGLFNQKKY